MSRPCEHLDLPTGLGQVRIRTVFSRSINLARDSESPDLARSYVPTSRAIQALEQVVAGLAPGPGSRALALIGPYGAGKSAFGQFLGALLSPPDGLLRQAALGTLARADPQLASQVRDALSARGGLLRVPINGIPDSLVRQLMLALAAAAERHGLKDTLVNRVRATARPGAGMHAVLDCIVQVRDAWSALGGGGLLIEIDELGKFLEYESYHPEHRELHLLQLLAEHASDPDPVGQPAPLLLVVMLHQAFEHYSHRLGRGLRDEWQKIQGRFGTIAFLEPPEQTLRVVAAAFERDGALAPDVEQELAHLAARLDGEGALPLGMDRDAARQLFDRCYPLHPLTLLILPTLCQKVAQNERTLFSYLASAEHFGLRQRLPELTMGEWIGPWELYDYFLLNQADACADPLTYHRWVEVIHALDRYEGQADSGTDDPTLRLLKTIGLLNVIGAQRGLKATRPLLELLFGAATTALLGRLETASIVHLRHYAREYRVWAGSDFDLQGAWRAAAAGLAELPLADLLNDLAPLPPIVARRASIATGTLRSFTPSFTARDRWPSRPAAGGELPLWIYLAEPEERPDLTQVPALAVVAVCRYTERLREVVTDWMALKDLPNRHAALHEDPVIVREHQIALVNAETAAVQVIRGLIEEPESLRWSFGGEPRAIKGRRDLQQQLSAWVEETCYPEAPLIRNELINREQPSTSAATGRKRLIAAMLGAAGDPGLGIDKAPAEKSLYLSLLKETGLHRYQHGRYDFYPPAEDPCRLRPLWNEIGATLGAGGEHQVPLPALYARLQAPPYGVRMGVLPILLIAYLLAHRREIALYQEGAFCETLTLDQAELLCRRPGLYTLERFELTGLRGELFDQYLSSVVGNLPHDASLLDIVRPLMAFTKSLPEYSLHCAGLSPEAGGVRAALRQAKSPGTLLFDTLPRACGVAPEAFAEGDAAIVEPFIQRLIQSLRELKGAYPALLAHWQEAIAAALLDGTAPALAGLRASAAARYRGLDRYAPEHSQAAVFIRRLADPGLAADGAWLESVMTLLGGAPPAKWRDATRMQAQLRLAEVATQLRDLEELRQPPLHPYYPLFRPHSCEEARPLGLAPHLVTIIGMDCKIIPKAKEPLGVSTSACAPGNIFFSRLASVELCISSFGNLYSDVEFHRGLLNG